MTKIAHILGDWSRNIGNAFFQLGGQYVLNQVFPNADIALIGEQPGYPSYWNPKGGNPGNFFDMASNIDVDYLVLMGPLFRKETEKIWSESFEKLLNRNVKIIYLGVAAMTYKKADISRYRNFLKNYPPYMFVTRDNETFQELGDLAKYAYDGIDLGFFIPDFYKPIGFIEDVSPFIAVSFDKLPSPVIKINEKLTNGKHWSKEFEFQNQSWVLEFNRFRMQLAKRSRYMMFVEGVLFRGNSQNVIGPYKIIRTDHRPHPLIKKKTFRDGNVFVSDIPYGYLEIYSQAELTLSNRLHACVAALSYGKNAMLISDTPRSRLLHRLNLDEIHNQPIQLDQDKIEIEKKSLIEFMKNQISK